MYRLLFVFLLFMHSLYSAESFLITEESNLNKTNLSEHISYINDSDKKLKYTDILDSKQLNKLNPQKQMKNKLGPYWSKLAIENNSNTTKNVILYNILPGVNYIDVYILKENKLYKKHLLGDLREQSTKEILGRYSMFELEIKPNEKYTIISKLDNYNVLNLSWIVSENKSFIENEYKNVIILSLIGGFFILFGIINFILYAIYKAGTYLILGVYTVNVFFYIFALQGLLYQLDLGINLTFLTYHMWIYPSVNSILLLLFTTIFFDIRENYKKFFYAMATLALFHIFVIAIITYAVLVDYTYSKYSVLIGLSVLLNSTLLVVAGIYMKEVGSKFYLTGQVLLIVAVFLSALNIFGVVKFSEVYRFLINGALIVDLILLLIAQSLKTKHNIEVLNKSKTALLEYSRFSSMGIAINNITHQWKHPLTHIGLSITLVESILKNKREKLASYLEKELPKISFSIELMKKTLSEFTNYYEKDIQKGYFSPKESIEKVSEILHSKIVLKNATLELEINDNLKIYNYEHLFSNIIMILIDNSLDEFDENMTNNKIYINIVKNNKHFVVTYQDNAGGIKVKPIEKVFDSFISSKNSKENQGIGLAMVKMLVEDRLNSKIYLSNKDGGVEFKILLI